MKEGARGVSGRARLEERGEIHKDGLDMRVYGERLAQNLQLDARRVRIARRVPGTAPRGKWALGTQRCTARVLKTSEWASALRECSDAAVGSCKETFRLAGAEQRRFALLLAHLERLPVGQVFVGSREEPLGAQQAYVSLPERRRKHFVELAALIERPVTAAERCLLLLPRRGRKARRSI